jgi:hypothetical protein
MRAMIAMRLGVAGAVVFGAVLPASAQQPGSSDRIPVSFCVIPLAAAGKTGVPGAGVDPNIPATLIGSGEILCTNSEKQQIVRLNCDALLEDYEGGSFEGDVPCDIEECGAGITRASTGRVNISGSGEVKLDCEIKRNQ